MTKILLILQIFTIITVFLSLLELPGSLGCLSHLQKESAGYVNYFLAPHDIIFFNWVYSSYCHCLHGFVGYVYILLFSTSFSLACAACGAQNLHNFKDACLRVMGWFGVLLSFKNWFPLSNNCRYCQKYIVGNLAVSKN